MNTSANKWKQEELDYLKNNYGVITLSEISLHLNRTEISVEKRAYRLIAAGELSYNKVQWTKEQAKQLKDGYEKLSIATLMELLNKSARQIHQKAYKLGITKGRYSIANYKGGKKKGEKQKMITSAIVKNKRVAKHVERRNKPLLHKPFSTEGKKMIKIDRKTSVYVPIKASQKEIDEILGRYKKAV
jgi:hypothetical protein